MADKELTDDELKLLRRQMHELWHLQTATPVQRALAHLAYEQCQNLIDGTGAPGLRDLQMRTLREVYDAFGGKQ